MTTKAELQTRADAMQAELTKMREQISQMPDDKAGRWKPKTGEIYYRIDWDSSCDGHAWGNDEYDILAYETFNVFPTPKAAEKEARMAKTMRHLRTLAGDWKPGNHESSYTFSLDLDKKRVIVDLWVTFMFATPHFKTRELAQSALAECGEDNVRELLGG